MPKLPDYVRLRVEEWPDPKGRPALYFLTADRTPSPLPMAGRKEVARLLDLLVEARMPDLFKGEPNSAVPLTVPLPNLQRWMLMPHELDEVINSLKRFLGKSGIRP